MHNVRQCVDVTLCQPFPRERERERERCHGHARQVRQVARNPCWRRGCCTHSLQAKAGAGKAWCGECSLCLRVAPGRATQRTAALKLGTHRTAAGSRSSLGSKSRICDEASGCGGTSEPRREPAVCQSTLPPCCRARTGTHGWHQHTKPWLGNNKLAVETHQACGCNTP